jgi:SAM-dependent methyltransferase
MDSIAQSNVDGHYARKQIFSRDRLVRWSHRRRFLTALSVAEEFAGARILDFGCGDGTFLGLAMRARGAPALAVGAELSRADVEDCRRRFHHQARLDFVTVDELSSGAHAGKYDAVFCLEVLEHLVNWEPEIELLGSLLADRGKLVISVPVEIGPSLVVKQLVRRIAGWRGVGHYPGTTSYSPGELLSSVFAGSAQHISRPVFDTGKGPFHDHKGFNWMVLRDRLRCDFVIERCFATPFPWLGPRAATQMWFILGRPSPDAEARV